MQTAFINKLENGSILGLLEIDVSTESLLEWLNWDQLSLIDFLKLRNEKKKKEWLGVRILLKEILNKQQFDLKYDAHGKPFLNDPTYNVSISHSGKFVCVLINKDLQVGIDIQEFKSNIGKGTGLFMSKKELEDCAGKMNLKTLHVYWGAKEAIYKFIGLKETNIKSDIYIFPFEFKKSGKLKGQYKNGKLVFLNYKVTEEYVLVYNH